MKKCLSILMLLTIVGTTALKAQVIIGGGYYGGGYYRAPYPPRRRPYVQQRKTPPFTPSVYVNLGYGFPNLDKNQLAGFPGEYLGNIHTQTGPYNASIDYRFSRFMSLGVMGMYGKVSAPYYEYYSQSNVPDFTGSLETWSLMLNIMNYIPVYDTHVEPYFRTAIGVTNVINQSYVDGSGNTVAYADNSSTLAYQVSFGARFKLSPNAGIFLEAGYGKYIASGGLSFKF